MDAGMLLLLLLSLLLLLQLQGEEDINQWRNLRRRLLFTISLPARVDLGHKAEQSREETRMWQHQNGNSQGLPPHLLIIPIAPQ
jgi:hypothetical protein